MLARMSSAVLIQRKGFGAALFALTKAVIALCSWPTLRCTPRRSWRWVSKAKKRSTWFSLARPHWQQRLRAVERLDLALLVNA